ncbi:MAG: phosphate ABC transporter substrate-binding protein PstS [Planctomycetes bacterium]|nr:phosphate ABC transporter substrate-binding protein PstS [Planctomycetota bacterium]
MSTKSLVLGTLALTFSACLVRADVHLQGAGATFPAPFYSRLVAEYQKLHPDVKIDYQAIGSGGGIKAITDGTVDFAGSDAPLGKKELEACGAENIVQIPSCAGAVVPAYNIPGVSAELKFTGEALADIFMGKINKWNDPRLVALNPTAGLPDLAITPAWRTDGSGTTYVWTNYLCTQSNSFKESIGAGKSVSWPLGQGGKGNQGVSAVLQSTTGSIGYIEENYADENKIPYGSVKNKAGKFVKATPETVSKAGLSAAAQMKGSVLAANMWDGEGEETYPIASLTYLIVYKDLKSVKTREQAQEVVNFLWWATHEGQKYAGKLNYAPLAPEMTKKVEEALAGLTFQGRPVKSL